AAASSNSSHTKISLHRSSRSCISTSRILGSTRVPRVGFGVAPKQAFQRIAPIVFSQSGKVRDRGEARAPRKLIAWEIGRFAQNDAVLRGASHVSHTRLQFTSQKRYRQAGHARRMGECHPRSWRGGFFLFSRVLRRFFVC